MNQASKWNQIKIDKEHWLKYCALTSWAGTEQGKNKTEHWWTEFKITMNTVPVFSSVELLSMGNG